LPRTAPQDRRSTELNIPIRNCEHQRLGQQRLFRTEVIADRGKADLRNRSDMAFTLEVYSHVLPHMQDTAAMKVEALLLAA
jgi:hypothetical protein